MAGRKAFAWAFLAALGACVESSEDAPKTPQTKLDGVATPISVSNAACAGSQAILPISGECDTGLPALYSDIDASAPLAFAKCVWKTFEAQLSENEAVRFRLQDCSNEPEAPVIGIAEKNRALTVTLSDRPVGDGYHFLQTYDLHGVDGMAFLESRRRALPAAERERCIVRPYEGSDFTGGRRWPNLYEIAPNPDYMKEILARDEPAAACGDEGWSNDGVRFWELRDGEAWFWDIGQEAPFYDPRSFTLLRRTGGESWSLADMKTPDLAN